MTIASSSDGRKEKFILSAIKRRKEERAMLGLIWAVSWRLAIFFGITMVGLNEYLNYEKRKEEEYGDE